MELELSVQGNERDIEAPRETLPPLNVRTDNTSSESNCAIASQCATVSGAVVGAVIGGVAASLFGINNILPVVVGGVAGGAIGASNCTTANAPSRPTQVDRVRQRREQREINQQIASPDR